MRKIFAEASLAAVNPSKDSAIDINMIDGIAGFTPADMVLGTPPAGAEAGDGVLMSSTTMENVHTIERSMRTTSCWTVASTAPVPNAVT